MALKPEAASKIQARPLHDIAAAMGQERATAAWTQLEKLDSAQKRVEELLGFDRDGKARTGAFETRGERDER